jgi:hypothetical protein
VSAHAQLLVYRFGSDAGFEGRLVGALERIEAGGAMRVLDVLFVASDRESGEIFAVEERGSGAGGFVGRLIGFRLDVEERRRITRRTASGGLAELLAALAEGLDRGEALAAILIGHEWLRALDDAVRRTGGTELANAFLEATSLATLGPELLESAASARPS